MTSDDMASSANHTGRWFPVLAGGAVALFGLSQRSLNGIALAAAGSAVAYRAMATTRSGAGGRAGRGVLPAGRGWLTWLPGKQRRQIRHGVAIARPADELFRYWRDFSNLPRFMAHLVSVERVGDDRWRWVAKAPGGGSVAWEARIVREEPGELIAWRSLPDSDVFTSGAVHFRRLPGDRGTLVHVMLEHDAPGGAIGTALARLTGEAPAQQVADDLRRFKQLMEAGEIPTTVGQPAGARTAVLGGGDHSGTTRLDQTAPPQDPGHQPGARGPREAIGAGTAPGNARAAWGAGR